MKRLSILLVVFNIIIIGRLFYLTIYNKDYYDNLESEKREVVIEGMSAPRGRIFDVKGNILVDNVGVKSIIYNKLNISTEEELVIAEVLASNIEINEEVSLRDLKYYYYLNNKEKVNNLVPENTMKEYRERKLNSNELLDIKLDLISSEMLEEINKKAAIFYYLMNNGFSYQDKIIKNNITDEEYIIINKLSLSGIRTDITWERIYPYGDVLKDIFGRVSTYKQGLPLEYKTEYLKQGYKLNDRVGISNLEYVYDHYLRGTKAKYKVENNKLKLIESYERGKDLVLSIDIDFQIKIEKILEEEMIKAKNSYNSKYFSESYVLVGSPSDGSIIAMVGKKIKEDLSFVDYSNYNILSSFNMGSSVKGATISVGYANGLIDENTKVYDSCIKLYRGKNRCSWTNLGTINDLNALRMSSNYFQYLIAVNLTGKKYTRNMRLNATMEHFNLYRNILKDYGLGNITGIDLLNENTGIKSRTVTDDLLLNISVGLYDTYTPISMLQYINTIATGKRIKLSLLKSVINSDGSIYYQIDPKVLNKAPVDEKYLNRIREGFRLVNTSGTGYSYTNRKVPSAGKTGTADSYLDVVDKTISTTSTSYVTYLPFDKPEYSIAIVSPHLSYKNSTSNYRYPVNSRVVREITNLLYND